MKYRCPSGCCEVVVFKAERLLWAQCTQINYNGAWHKYADLALEVGLAVDTVKARLGKRQCLRGRMDAPVLFLNETQQLAARFLCGRQP